ncbi:MAG: EAL domain-containing protein [Coriobacteriales bacterium]|nr:EAL domain-containing protein [Coriobacteriales bacterium]
MSVRTRAIGAVVLTVLATLAVLFALGYAVGIRNPRLLSREAIAMAGVGLAIIAGLGLALHGPLLSRLIRLSNELTEARNLADPSVRVTVDGSDEIGSIASGINDMLDAIQRSEQSLAFLASHDPLTQLVNRRRFEEELTRECREASRLESHGALLWMDIDSFKAINDGLGHATGDELLVQFSRALVSGVRSYSTVARLGGDEFAIVLPHAGEDSAMSVANRLSARLLDEPFSIDGHAIQVTASIGVVLYPQDGTSIEELMARADLAMYEAKEGGRGRISVYSGANTSPGEMARNVAWVDRITTALREDRFDLHAMPIRRLANGSDGPYELLLRLRGDDGEFVSPTRVVAAAEKVGLVQEIDHWVLTRAIRMLADERAQGRDTSFSVNLSSRALHDPDLLNVIGAELAATGIDPSRLVLEVSESATVANIPHTQEFIAGIKELGCRFLVDDFGAGASSFMYLRQLPVDFLKIDGALVRNLVTRHTDKHFIRAIVEMCRGLDIQTVAEFVENPELLEAIGDQGVDFAQGYEIGEPEPWDVYAASLPVVYSDSA